MQLLDARFWITTWNTTVNSTILPC